MTRILEKRQIGHGSHQKHIHFWRMYLKGSKIYENTIIKGSIFNIFPVPLKKKIVSENLKKRL